MWWRRQSAEHGNANERRAWLDRVRALLRPSNVPKRGAKLSAEALHHTYGNDVEALKGVSLNVRSGEFVCLLGPSGCGKSTLLQMLAGHIRPTDGTVSIDGRVIEGPGPDRLLMFQEAALYPWRTVEGNVCFALAARGIPRAERRERARHYIRMVQLEGFEDTLPHQLSGGMKMRASLARALSMDSAVLLMDEPLGALDAQTRVRMQILLRDLWRASGKTIVFVTHDVREALTMGTRVVVMAPRPGRIIRDVDVELPVRRDPDDPEIAALAREIRQLLDAVDPPQEETRHGVEERPAALGHPGAAAGPVGAGV